VDNLQYVINYEIPNIPETYVHRIGRTGRAGAAGTAISFCDAIEKEYIRDIEKLINRSIPVVEDHNFPLEDHNPIVEPKVTFQRNTPRNKEAQQKPKGNGASQKNKKPFYKKKG
jgi:ATP-dependent RNA helicase RhlE